MIDGVVRNTDDPTSMKNYRRNLNYLFGARRQRGSLQDRVQNGTHAACKTDNQHLIAVLDAEKIGSSSAPKVSKGAANLVRLFSSIYSVMIPGYHRSGVLLSPSIMSRVTCTV